MPQPSALQSLLSGVRLAPSSKLRAQAAGSGGASNAPDAASAELASDAACKLPAAVDFFRDGAAKTKKEKEKAVLGDGSLLRMGVKRGEDSEDADNEEEQKIVTEEEKIVTEEENMALGISAALMGQMAVARAMVEVGAGVLTGVQERAMASVCWGKDVIAVAPTGSGKTLSYAAPLLAGIAGARAALRELEGVQKNVNAKIKNERKAPAALVLVPTRELAAQVAGVIGRLAHAAKMRLAVVTLASKAALQGLGGGKIDVVVATPARAGVAIERGVIDFGSLQHVVLDEADRLLDDGFIGQVDEVLAACGDARRLHAFSATMPGAIEDVLRGLMADPVKVVIGGGGYGGAAAVSEVARLVSQRFVFAGAKGEEGKVVAIRSMLKEGIAAPVLVFVQSKERAAELFRELIFDGVDVDAIHADRSGAARSSAIARFRAGRLPVLIATDVLARGLDFRAVETVINYDMPTNAANYVHRIGRTGRAGRLGAAVTLFTQEDGPLLRGVARVARESGATVPDWMLAQVKLRKDEKERMEVRPPRRKRIGGAGHSSLPKKRQKVIVPKRTDFDEGEEVGGDDRTG